MIFSAGEANRGFQTIWIVILKMMRLPRHISASCDQFNQRVFSLFCVLFFTFTEEVKLDGKSQDTKQKLEESLKNKHLCTHRTCSRNVFCLLSTPVDHLASPQMCLVTSCAASGPQFGNHS